jgi:hypothetical protein
VRYKRLKKSVSIVLLLALLFNIAGYNLLFLALKYQARTELIEHLDANTYTADRTIIIKIPLSIPYQTDWTAYERVDGDFEHQGEFYRLVKQKLHHDTLYVVCIKDHKQKQLTSAMGDFTKLVNDLPGTSTTLKLLGSFQKEYRFSSAIELFAHQSGWFRKINYPVATAFSPLYNEQELVAPPPESFS